MEELLGSQVKAQILLYLGTRGGSSGRRLARLLRKSPTQVFKALRQLEKARIISKFGPPYFYALNSEYPYHEELIRMIYKKSQLMKKKPSFIPKIAEDRKVDPFAVYELANLIGPGPKIVSFSDAIRNRYDRHSH